VCATVVRLGPGSSCEYRFARGMPCEGQLGRSMLPAEFLLH